MDTNVKGADRCVICGAPMPEGRLVCPACEEYAMLHPEKLQTGEEKGVKNMTDWKEWIKAAGIRAIRTFAEAMLAYIGTGAIVLGDVNWVAALSAGGLGFVLAILLALAGLPEVETHPPED